MQIVVIAPNWLGDAVMALPVLEDVRAAFPEARIAVAARRSIVDLFRLVPTDAIVALRSDARWWRRAAYRADADALRGFDVALLLPNSFASAWLVRTAGIPERWGYAADGRSRLLTRPVPRTKGGHQAEYYQRLPAALGLINADAGAGLRAPSIDVAGRLRAAAGELLAAGGHPAGAPLIVLAPGAAYGKAKQWIPAHASTLVARLAAERGATCAMVGSRADAAAAAAVTRALPRLTRGRIIDLIGRTTLETLAGVLACADACVANDSGAMHLAAAVGTPVVAPFGPTDERATRPLARPGRQAAVLTHEVWCRPCMLRECPIDHRCMRGIPPDRVFDALASVLPR